MAAVALTGVVNGSGKYCISQLDTVPGTHSLDQSCDAIEVAILQDEDVDFAEDAVKDVDAYSGFESTNVKCTSHDESYATFEYCFLKAINRTYKYVSIKVKLHQVPVNFALYERLNGYKPFLYNVTVDACNYLLKPKGNPVVTFIFGLFAPYSNMNHSCPFNVSIYREFLPVLSIFFSMT
ncbi:uncharacterized protein Dere_GG17091 [Drosophila erecta]|nr:uncharacterized protein Dere_GG17091 [Drosophila erecta]